MNLEEAMKWADDTKTNGYRDATSILAEEIRRLTSEVNSLRRLVEVAQEDCDSRDGVRLDALLYDERLDIRKRRSDGLWSVGNLETAEIVAVERDPREAIDVYLAALDQGEPR